MITMEVEFMGFGSVAHEFYIIGFFFFVFLKKRDGLMNRKVQFWYTSRKPKLHQVSK